MSLPQVRAVLLFGVVRLRLPCGVAPAIVRGVDPGRPGDDARALAAGESWALRWRLPAAYRAAIVDAIAREWRAAAWRRADPTGRAEVVHIALAAGVRCRAAELLDLPATVAAALQRGHR